jgi:enoyl-CoA hydratase
VAPGYDNQDLLVEMRGSSLWLTLNRPASKNALTPDVLMRLPALLEQASENEACAVVVVTGVGNSFSSGYDLGHIKDNDGKQVAGEVLRAACDALERCAVPTIARIDGWCVGAGLEFALSCDVRLSTSRSTFFLPASRLGIAYPERGLRRIVRAVGASTACRIALFGERITALEALRTGLVNCVDDEIDALVKEWEAAAAAGDRSSVTAMKRVLRVIGEESANASTDGGRGNGTNVPSEQEGRGTVASFLQGVTFVRGSAIRKGRAVR